MKAIAIVPGTPGARLIEVPEPAVTAPGQVKLRVLRVGICGTDREQAAGGRAMAPAGRRDLVIGHEMLGRVVETGWAVTRLKAGDLAVLTVRRKCDRCLPCSMGRPDMCRTGQYRERGIWSLDGYQAEYVVDSEEWAVRVPPELETAGVLAEPLSVVEKAIDESVRVQFARLPAASATPLWLHGRRSLVAGLGPVGLLAALALRLRGAEVLGLDIVDPESARPQWLAAIGGRYVDGRQVEPARLDSIVGPIDFLVEAAGVPSLAFNLLDALGPSGVCVLTGIPAGSRTLELPAAELVRRLVLNNLALLGSVNAARDHFQMAVDDLAQARLLWGATIEGLITHRHPYTDFAAALGSHQPDEIKAVLEWHPQPRAPAQA